MGLFSKVFGGNGGQVETYEDFWKWFLVHDQKFYDVLMSQKNIHRDFYEKLPPKLKAINLDEIAFAGGKKSDDICGLIFTAEGDVKNIVLVEELVDAAPEIEGWDIMALKPAIGPDDLNIEIGGFVLNRETLWFTSKANPELPDEIDVTVVHEGYDEKSAPAITKGVFVYVDNLLGELSSLISIDMMTVAGKEEVEGELIAIEGLGEFLENKRKEFIDKYEGIRRDTKNDSYEVKETELDHRKAMVTSINNDLLDWESKGSHPWIMEVEVGYRKMFSNGLPKNESEQLLEELEDAIEKQLSPSEGYLNVGRQTAEGKRIIYFACTEF